MRRPQFQLPLLAALVVLHGCGSTPELTGAAAARARGASVDANPETAPAGSSSVGGPASPWLDDARVLARVNGVVLTLREVRHAIGPAYDEFLRDLPQLEEYVQRQVQGLVQRRLVIQEGLRLGIDVSDEAFEDEIRRKEKAAAERRSTLEQTIKDYGMTRREFEQNVRDDLRWQFAIYIFTGRYDRIRLREEFRPAVDTFVSPAELRAWEERHPEVSRIPESITLRAVEIRNDRVDLEGAPERERAFVARRVADRAREFVLTGQDMAAVAREHSHGREADQGGLWEPFGRDTERLQVVKDWAFQEGRAVGDVSEPLSTPTGYLVLRVEEYTPARTASIEEWGPQVHQQLTEAKRELAYVDVRLRLVEQATITPASLRDVLLRGLREERRAVRDRLK